MTWRPTKYLVEGELDNRVPGIIVGWLRFAGVDDKVSLELEGDLMSDIRGKRLKLSGRYEGSSRVAWKEMRGFRADQLGRAGWITAGGPNEQHIDYPYYAGSAVMSGSALRPGLRVPFPEPDLA